jgi:hypothetical protein
MRAILTVIIGMFGFFICLGVSAYIGVQLQSWIVFLIILTISNIVFFKFLIESNEMGRVNMEPWLRSVKDFKYKYAWDGTGIAVDSTSRKIYLVSKFDKKNISKEYSFGEIRKWEYNIPGLTKTLGNVSTQLAFDVATSNLMDLEKTGLWLTVKDTEYPKWFIKFKCDNKTDIELSRWMEILSQEINNE